MPSTLPLFAITGYLRVVPAPRSMIWGNLCAVNCWVLAGKGHLW